MLTQYELENRKKFLNASEIAAAMGVSSYRTPAEVWAPKCGLFEDEAQTNAAMQAGNSLESVILDRAEADFGTMCRQQRFELPEYRAGATVDAYVPFHNVLVEAKTSGIVGPLKGEWGEEESDEVPLEYFLQCHFQMAVAKATKCYLYALLGGRGFVRYVLPSEPEHEAELLAFAAKWMATFVDGKRRPPDADPSVALALEKRRIRRWDSAVDLPECVDTLLDEFDRTKQEIKALEKERDRLQAEIMGALGDSAMGKTPRGSGVEIRQMTRTNRVVLEETVTKWNQLFIKRGKQ